MSTWLVYVGVLLYMEVVYHIGSFQGKSENVLFSLGVIFIWSSLLTLVTGILKNRWRIWFFWVVLITQFLIFSIQAVYYKIFKQPLLFKAILMGGQDALTNYYREALEGVVAILPMIFLFLFPLLIIMFLNRKHKWNPLFFTKKEGRRCIVALALSTVFFLLVLWIGAYLETDYYEEYMEFYDPLSVAKQVGVLAMVQRDIFLEVGEGYSVLVKQVASDSVKENLTEDITLEEVFSSEEMESSNQESNTQESVIQESVIQESVTEEIKPENVLKKREYNELQIDWNMLKQLSANSKEATWLADYIFQQEPTNCNEYTGFFEGYNLIYITAEGFSTYAINEEITPTLYKLANSGFVFSNYYVPLWQTSTSDGEYINLTGLIPDGQFSMRKSGANNMLFSLPHFFEQDGITSYAYHNNSLSYYDRYITHNNLGYIFKASKLGSLDAAQWQEYVFPMENPDAWPASDYEMMQGTVSDYIGNERFHAYYMSVSGHMNYNFKGNSMSSKNKEAVAHLEMSENARAYLACQIELDKALEYLLGALKEAGKLEKTVICISADHYPYAMSTEEYNELAGKDLTEKQDVFRNSFILWNSEMKETVYVEKASGSMDILPTLLNLFGYTYDSRMYAGRDVFSKEEGMVIFNDKSFVTDTVIYNKKTKETTWLVEHSEEEKEEYFEEIKRKVNERYQFSAYILRENYYNIIEKSLIE